MTRPLRIEIPDAWYHVMNRGRRGEKVFLLRQDYTGFIDLLKESCKMWGIRIGAYCLMPNHYHLLIQTPEANLSRCMRHINGVYTQRFNRRHLKDGQLFRGRYKSILVDADNYLLELLRYIHRNPLRAGIVDRLDDYMWSSHKGYLSESRQWKWLAKDSLLCILEENNVKWRSKYISFVEKEIPEQIETIFNAGKLPSILGTEKFLEQIKKKYYKKKLHKDIPQSRILAPGMEKIIRVVCNRYQVSADELCKPRRGRNNEAKKAAIYLIRKYTGLSLIEISKQFNMSNYSSAGSVILRTKKQLLHDKKFRRSFEKLEKELTSTNMR